jgi:D-alanyl-D-alanine carboxypeptidase
MRRRSRIALASALVALACGAVLLARHDQRPTTAPARPDLQRVLDRLVAQKGVAPGAVAAVVTPKGTWVGAAGVANLATKEPASPDDWFRIASITKTYTASLVLRLVAEKKLSLSDTVGERLPGVLPADKATITIRQLLAHTSGLYDTINEIEAVNRDPAAFYASLHDPAYAARLRKVFAAVAEDPTTEISPRLWVDVAAREPLYFPPGTGSHYSSTNYVLLGWIVEKATHQTLGEAMKTRLFEPLGLKHTAYVPGPVLPSPAMHGYVIQGANRYDATRVTLGIAGGSAVAATAEDVARFYRALAEGRVVPSTLRDGTMLPEQMGIGSYPTACGSAHGHGGAWQGYISQALVANDGRAVALFLNGRGTASDRALQDAATKLFCAA